MLNLLDRLGDWNPQLLREIKGRLKRRNVLATIMIAIGVQALLAVSFLGRLPASIPNQADVWLNYCFNANIENLCVRDATGKFAIDWQDWWHDLYLTLGSISIYVLLVVGTYQLISDLAQEERRGTLNFIRLSPRSALNIFVGKILGVPILLYLALLLALPLQIWAGVAAHLPAQLILFFYMSLAANSALFYSAALLYGLTTTWLKSLQAWIGGLAVFVFLIWAHDLPKWSDHSDYPLIWFQLLTSHIFLPQMSDIAAQSGHSFPPVLKWFHLSIDLSDLAGISFILLNLGIGVYWLGQALHRSFSNPNATLISKRSSYLLVACVTAVCLGFTFSPLAIIDKTTPQAPTWIVVNSILLLNLFIFLALIAALTPRRQGLQDWARYRHAKPSNLAQLKRSHRSLISDLLLDDASPAILTIGVNLAIAFLPVIPLILGSHADTSYQFKAILSLFVFALTILLFATLVQLFLLMRTDHRTYWAAGSLGIMLFLPLILSDIFNSTAFRQTAPWEAFLNVLTLLSTTPLQLEPPTNILILLTLAGQGLIVFSLNAYIARQVYYMGQSASKALFAKRSILPSSS